MTEKKKAPTKNVFKDLIIGVSKLYIEDFNNQLTEELDITEKDPLQFKYSARLEVKEGKNRLIVSVYYAFLRGEKVLFEIRVNTEFLVNKLHNYFELDRHHRKMVLNKLVDLSNAHTRAMLSMKLEGSKFSSLYVPMLPPDEISESLLGEEEESQVKSN